MNNKLLLPTLLLSAAASAQTITFDTDDYRSVSVYDSWTESPFRTGQLAGNASVHDGQAYLQRSRYGSNLFGLRVDLTAPFRLTQQARYVHVRMKRPVQDSRMMLITLGRRSERKGQDRDVEQSWSLNTAPAGSDGYCDAVFAIKGFSSADPTKDGIDIHSLVICPDVTDRSGMKEDFVCSVDDIVINDDPTPRSQDTAGRAIRKIVARTTVGDWGTMVGQLEVTVSDPALLQDLKAGDFDIQGNAAGTFFDVSTNQPVQPYADDSLRIHVSGNTLTITAKPFDYEGVRDAQWQKQPWQVVCKRPELSFSQKDVTEKHTEIIDDCIRGSFTFAGITREYMLYLPRDAQGNRIPSVPLFVWQIGGGEYNQPLTTVALANRCLASLPQHGQQCATLVFALANPNYSYSASLDPEKIKLIDRNNALQMAFIDELIGQGMVDKDRLFCAGASSGGGCTLRFMMQFAHRFRAAIPVCAMDPIVPIHIPLREKPGTNMGSFTDQVEKVWRSQEAVYTWNGTEMVAQPMDIQAFTRLPMYFVHAQDDGTCNVLSSYIYRDARRRLGATDDRLRIYSDDEMRAYGFGGPLSHFSWVRMLNDYGPGEAMDWLTRMF